ncbi:MAG: multiple sugar transport system substrate-binding protein, partial [Candidatus Promineifilaceae bacterium]
MSNFRKLWLTFLVILALFLVACGGPEAPAVEEPAVEEPAAEEVVEEEPAVEEPAVEEPAMEEEAMADGEKVTIRWFVGLGTGSNEDQIPVQDGVVEKFNASQDRIELVVEYVDNDQATTILNTQISGGNSPDIIGPVGVAGRAAFTDAILDLRPLMEANNYDLSDFDPAMVDFYELENKGQVGLPFGIFPSFIYVNLDLFDEAGLEYPPQEYGVPYILDGEEVPWNMDTVREIGLLLTVDENGNDATMDGFDPEAIVQFGYGVQWADVRGQAALFGADSFHDGAGGAQTPAHWVDAMQWYHDAMWTDVFMPNGAYGGSDLLNAGNWFESGNMAMDQVHLWYATCCTGGLEANWDLAVMPAAPDGSITAKMHADTFAILEGSEHPQEAFEVMSYLIDEAADELTQLYGGLPARLSLQSAYFDKLDADAFADKDINWDVVTASMAYPDNPNHEEGYPNELPARDALAAFSEQMNNNPDFDVEAGLAELQANLQSIFDGADFVPAPVEEEAMEEEAMADGEKVTVRWFVGLGTGSNEDQIPAQDEVVAEFNASQDAIELVIEYVDNDQATTILNTQISGGNSPDIIGPVGVAGRAAFTDAILDLRPLIEASNYDLSDFDPAMVDFYELENRGQVGLPFGIFPSFIYVNLDLFDEAGLEYPPQEYGAPYILDGVEVPWNMDTVREIGLLLTVDENGNDATMDGFDPEAIVQFGYGVQWADVRGQAALFGADSFHDGAGGAQVPAHWVDAMQWYHDAMWTDVFMPNGAYGGS